MNQIDPIYLAALTELNAERGAGRFARGCELVARIFGLTVSQVISDAVALA